jgi:hypothetical protein
LENDLKRSKRDIILILTLANKVPSGQYLVGGSSFGCQWDTRWCGVDAETPLDENKLILWKDGEPSNSSTKMCVVLEFSLEMEPHMTFLKGECNIPMKTIYESIKELY